MKLIQNFQRKYPNTSKNINEKLNTIYKLLVRLIPILLISIVFFFYINNRKNNDSNYLQKNENKQSCIGNENCIDKVRFNFTNSGKQILNETYNGNGVFTITGLDPSKGVTFNSTVTTDCNCELINVKTSDIN